MNAEVNFCQDAQDSKLGMYKPTHVVSAITYGGGAHIQFKKVNQECFFSSFLIINFILERVHKL